MSRRGIAIVGVMAAAVAGVLVMAQTDARQAPSGGAWTPPLTAWGEPDLQGVWRNETITPLERPPDLAGKEFYTQEEAAALVAEREARERPEGPSEPSARQPAGTYNQFWQDTGTASRPYTRTSMIVGPQGTIPFTPAARQKEEFEDGRYGKGPYNHWRDVDTGERCITDGLAGSVWTGTAGGPQQIRQGPGYVLIMGEQFHDRRIVPTDGRAHGTVRHWLGESVGRWDGQTLVIETKNFLDRSNERWVAPWRASTETLRLVERLRRVDADTIEYQLTIEDPERFTSAWTVEVPLSRLDQPFFEYACHEGNYGIIHTLSGARALEKSGQPGTR